MAVPLIGRSGVGVVEISGIIGGGGRVPVYSRILEGLRREKRFKAVVVEIDSPGGDRLGLGGAVPRAGQGGPREACSSLHQGHGGLGRLLHQLRRRQNRRPSLGPCGAP